MQTYSCSVGGPNPAAKTTDWMQDRTAFEKALSSGVSTGLLLRKTGDIAYSAK